MIATPTYPYYKNSVWNRNQLGRLRGLGWIATPYYPYDPHSVWNRNQLGQLNLSDPMTLGLIALAGWAAYRMAIGKKIF
jgi:hypothetical protein